MADKESQEIQVKQSSDMSEPVERAREGRVFTPPTDIRETDGGIVLTADMPGVAPDGVEVTLEANVLEVRGRFADEHRRDGEPRYAEYDVGDYERSFSISDEIDRDGIEARMNAGVLTLTLPKAKPSRKRIEVRSE